MPFSNSLFLSSKQFCLISSQLITLFKQMESVESHLIYLDKETCWNKQEHLLSEHADILFICTNRRVGWKVALSWHLFTPLSTVWAGSSRQVTDSRWCQSKLAPEAREVKFIFSVLPGENEKTDKFGNMKPIFKKICISVENASVKYQTLFLITFYFCHLIKTPIQKTWLFCRISFWNKRLNTVGSLYSVPKTLAIALFKSFILF